MYLKFNRHILNQELPYYSMKYHHQKQNELRHKIARQVSAIIRWHGICTWHPAIWKWRYTTPFVEYVMHT